MVYPVMEQQVNLYRMDETVLFGPVGGSVDIPTHAVQSATRRRRVIGRNMAFLGLSHWGTGEGWFARFATSGRNLANSPCEMGGMRCRYQDWGGVTRRRDKR